MEEIIIRDTTFEDIESLRAMHAQSWIDTYPNAEHDITKGWVSKRVAGWTSPQGIEKSVKHFQGIIGNPLHMHKVALAGDTIVGCMHVSVAGEKQQLEAIYIDKSYHGTGLAHALIGQALEWIDQSKSVLLEVATYNERAKSFYKKYKFKEVPGSEHMFADKIPVIVMERKGDIR